MSEKRVEPRLSTRNPLDYLRLLWWVLAAPEHLRAYRERFGREDERRLGQWVVSTLTWGLLLIPTLALGWGRLPHAGKGLSPVTYLWLSGALVMVWFLQGWLGERWSRGVVFSGSMLALVVALDLACPGPAQMALVSVFLLAAGAVGGIANVMAGGMAPVLPFAQGLLLAGGVSLGLGAPKPGSSLLGGLLGLLEAVAVGGMAALVIAGGLGAGLDASITLSLKTGRPSWLGKAALVILSGAYLFLIWFCFLGGWQTFS